MAQIFHRSFNTISKVSIVALVSLVAIVIVKGNVFVRSPYLTRVGVAIDQPVPFSHKHHVTDVGLDCRYCHGSVEDSSFAGIPSTHTCMTCHSQIWTEAPILEPVRKSYRYNTPLIWTRVHNLPDFVYFDHSIHIAKGVACTSCHGPVNEMPLTWREHTLQMTWCLDCHRQQKNAPQLTNCSVCHR